MNKEEEKKDAVIHKEDGVKAVAEMMHDHIKNVQGYGSTLERLEVVLWLLLFIITDKKTDDYEWTNLYLSIFSKICIKKIPADAIKKKPHKIVSNTIRGIKILIKIADG